MFRQCGLGIWAIIRIICIVLLIPSAESQDIRTLEFANSVERWDDGDLYTFVSRPDIKSPRLNLTIHDKNAVSPGYLFVAPYDYLYSLQGDVGTSYAGQQIGPQIYDWHGELVWSGSSLFRNRQTFDFKATTIHGREYLTLVTSKTTTTSVLTDGVAIVLDSSYQTVATVTAGDGYLDMHEFTVLDDGQTALISVLRRKDLPPTQSPRKGALVDYGFREVDVKNGDVIFEWWATDHVPLSESAFGAPPMKGGEWDYFHLNSVDKTESGDYLISGRHTNAIYLVSGSDGSIIWRLGGLRSDFILSDFNFSRQHDARVQAQNHTTMEITLFDNAWDGYGSEYIDASGPSSFLLHIALHLSASPMTATVIKRIPSPDGEYTLARGNTQLLANGNYFGGWGDSAYMSEHTSTGEIAFEASFLSDRFVNYRAYKLNFTGQPTEFPTVKAFAASTSKGSLTTVVYASWDGATEVHTWRAYSAVDEDDDSGTFIGSVLKTGFETSFVCSGYHPLVYVEALDVNGIRLSRSLASASELPLGWDADELLWSYNTSYQLNSQLRKLATSFFAGMVVMFCFLRWRYRRRLPMLPHWRLRHRLYDLSSYRSTMK